MSEEITYDEKTVQAIKDAYEEKTISDKYKRAQREAGAGHHLPVRRTGR